MAEQCGQARLNLRFPLWLWIPALMLLGACHHAIPSPGRFTTTVNSDVVPGQATIADHGIPQTVAASRDDKGVQSEFIVGIVLLKPRSAADLRSFLTRYQGTVVSDDTIREPPPELGITLTAEQRKPTQYRIRFNLDRVDVDRVLENAAAVGLIGALEFSSEDARKTFAATLDAKAAGFRVSNDYVYVGHQVFPIALFNTQERLISPGPPATFNDPFKDPNKPFAFPNPAYADFGATGNGSNVFLAWQFVAAHGIQRRTVVAIIDGGFYLDPAGRARGTDSDFPPAPGRPFQYDFDFDDPNAGDTNSGPGCGSGNPCWWHGTGAAGVAMGIGNNRLGEMGTGAQVAVPLLYRTNSTRSQRNRAIREAVQFGADVVSMSFGGQCDVWCRKGDRDDNPFDDAVDDGKKVVFIASAGNGQGDPAVGFNVSDLGASSFIHPCVEQHVICVGALDPGAKTKIQYSNFGDGVLIFAPTEIPVMSYPPSKGIDGAGKSFPLPVEQADGPPTLQVFGGTSASAPFVAGVVAMMKAVNPDLNHDAVAQILRETATAGVAPANRLLNAYAAVRRAAGASAIVKDALENNDLETAPTNLGSIPPYNRMNLNIDNRDRDYFRFDSPNGSLMTISLASPQGLGTLSVHSLSSPRANCEVPARVKDDLLPGGGHSLVYSVPGGPLELGLRANDVSAYNLAITFASGAYPFDFYELNNTVATARRLSTRRSIRSGEVIYVSNDPRATVDATIDNPADVDFYIVRGATLTSREQIFLGGFPSLEVYGNDSAITLEVFDLNPDNSQGAPVASLKSGGCAPVGLEVRLAQDAYYLVKVFGSPGRYTLKNNVDGEPRRFPVLTRDRSYEVAHPGDPIERSLRFPEIFVFVANRAFTAIRTAGQHVTMRLTDMRGRLVASGVGGKEAETLSLAAVSPGEMYALEVKSKGDGGNRPPLNLTWDAAQAKRASRNLISNAGAETMVQGGDEHFADWERVDGLAPPRGLSYGEGDDAPSSGSPGPKDRGSRLFANGADNAPSGIQQRIPVDHQWRVAIEKGRVEAHLSGFLGGSLNTADLATVHVSFLNFKGRELGTLSLATVGPRERENETGLLPVASSRVVPAGTATIRVALTFGNNGAGGGRRVYADNLELILSEYSR